VKVAPPLGQLELGPGHMNDMAQEHRPDVEKTINQNGRRFRRKTVSRANH